MGGANAECDAGRDRFGVFERQGVNVDPVTFVAHGVGQAAVLDVELVHRERVVEGERGGKKRLPAKPCAAATAGNTSATNVSSTRDARDVREDGMLPPII